MYFTIRVNKNRAHSSASLAASVPFSETSMRTDFACQGSSRSPPSCEAQLDVFCSIWWSPSALAIFVIMPLSVKCSIWLLEQLILSQFLLMQLAVCCSLLVSNSSLTDLMVACPETQPLGIFYQPLSCTILSSLWQLTIPLAYFCLFLNFFTLGLCCYVA